MKSIIFILIYLVSIGYAQAQKIKLRNTEFIKALRADCPKCIDKKNTLTAECEKIKRLDFIIEQNNRPMFGDELEEEVEEAQFVTDGIDFSIFTNLEQLTISGYVASKIINWPKKLKALDLTKCHYNQTMPNLPDGLLYLNLEGDFYDYSQGRIQYLFDYIQLPKSLEVLIMKYNIKLKGIKSLPPKLKVLVSRYNEHASHLLDILPNSLKVLRLEESYLTDLPDKLPDSLQYLYLSHNYLETLPSLPPNLLVLDLNDNMIDTFPDSFPKGLKELSLHRNHLEKLPENLPVSLEKLNLSRQMLKVADFSRFVRLKELYISGNELSRLILPKSIEILNCGDNKLSFFEDSLPKLKELYINNNQLSNFKLYAPKLTFLDCSNNLISLDSLNIKHCQKLKVLDCSHNQLQQIKPLPNSLTQLNCANNQLTELSLIPPNLFYLDYSGNKITTLPKFPPHLTQIVDKTEEEIEAENEEHSPKSRFKGRKYEKMKE